MVFVINKNKKPLPPIHNGEARKLLSSGLAVIIKRYPFVIRLKLINYEIDKSFTIKIDPGSKETGFSIMDKNLAIFLGIIQHRGEAVKVSLKKRASVRKDRRNRNTRYRKIRFNNRTRPKGWLPPSIKSRADNIINFVKKTKRYINIFNIEIESVSFDTSSITCDKKLIGKEYQKGPLFESNLRSAVFAKSKGFCVYCEKKGEEIDHIIPRISGGTNSYHNLVCACRSCNERKGKLSLKEFGKLIKKDFNHLEPRKLPKDAAIIQSARNYTIKELSKICNVDAYPAWMTAFNRIENGYPKEHFFDAVCVGKNQKYFIDKSIKNVLIIKAVGRGSRQMCLMDKYGFPRTRAKKTKQVHGFKTGDIVKAIVLNGKYTGTHIGKVAVRSTGIFNIGSCNSLIQGINYKYCYIIQKSDGYEYTIRKLFLSNINMEPL